MEISLSQEQIEKLVADSLPDIKKQVVETIAARMSWTLQEKCTEILMAEVKQFMAEQVVPEVKAALTTKKDMLVGVAAEASPKLAMIIGEALAEQLKKNLEGYKRQTIFKAMFQ